MAVSPDPRRPSLADKLALHDLAGATAEITDQEPDAVDTVVKAAVGMHSGLWLALEKRRAHLRKRNRAFDETTERRLLVERFLCDGRASELVESNVNPNNLDKLVLLVDEASKSLSSLSIFYMD
mmetsp:Transcript_1017/g.3021  ORF Transcript_1017/g.3021 Transcript_1017/m.3021 type:complete len:124 (-) Transcript_1017:149-520(-)